MLSPAFQAALFLVFAILSAFTNALPFGVPVTQTLALSSTARGLSRDVVAPVVRQIDRLAIARPPVAPLVAHDIKPSLVTAYSKPSKPVAPSALAASLDRSAESILLPFDTKAEKQGQVGACHIFTTTQVLYNLFNEATDKVLHTNSFFADHLVNPQRFGLRKTANTKDFLMEHHLGAIERIRNTPGGRACRDDLGLEGGLFANDLRLLQNVGSLLVDKNNEWKYMDSAIRSIDLERQKLVMAKADVDPDIAKKRLGDAGFDYVFSKSVQTPEMTDLMKADREIVKQVVSSLRPIHINMAKAYGKMPMTKALQKSKKDIIEMLHQYGVAWLGVDFDRYMNYAYSHKLMNLDLGFAETGNHAISLVGYKKEGDLFIVKDSNFGGTRNVKANNLLLSMEEIIFVKGR